MRSGHALVEVEGQAPVTLGPGGIAILPRNDPHLLASRTGLPPADVGEIGWITADGVHRVASGTGGAKAEVWCGFLGTAKDSAHPLLDALPPLLTLDASGGEAEWLDSSMRFLAEQHPSPEVVARLAELFLSQASRNMSRACRPIRPRWLKGLAVRRCPGARESTRLRRGSRGRKPGAKLASHARCLASVSRADREPPIAIARGAAGMRRTC